MAKVVKQRDVTDCGAACLASITSHYGLQLPVSRIRQLANTDQRGTTVLGMTKAAQQFGFNAKAVRGPIESLDSIPLPAIAHLIVRERLQHYVVIYKSGRDQLTVMDPATGRMEELPRDTFAKQWTGVLILVTPDETFKPGNHKRSLASTLWSLLMQRKSVFLQALAGAVVYTLLGLSTSFYVKILVDYVFIQKNTNLLNLISLLMIGLLAMQLFISVVKSVLTLQTGQAIDRQLILGYHQHLLKLPQSFFATMRTGEIISRINDAVKIRAFINDALLTVLVNILVIVFSFSLMFAYHPRLTLLLAASIPLYLLVYAITSRLNRTVERRMMEESADLEAQLVESIQSMSTIKSLGIENVAQGKTFLRFDKLLQTMYTSGRNTIFSGAATEHVSKLFTILLFWAGTHYVLDQTLTPGELLSFYALIAYFTGPVSSLIGMNRVTQSAMIAADRLFEIMDLETEDAPGKKLPLTRKSMGDIRFSHVSFRYGGRDNVLEDVTFTIPQGKFTAIVGESGSGKSTLISVLQGLYPVQSGEVRIGHHDIRHVDIATLRSLIGVVPQRIDLFAGNVIDNIAPGCEEPNMQRIVELCHQLGILPFIEQLPAGFDSYLGENGTLLSGGQKQRVAIARALYRDPEIIILDEATASLDPVSEQFVRNTLEDLRRQGKTIIFIGHRLGSVRTADKIVVLDNGRLAEEGTHEGLYATRGYYYRLWQYQAYGTEPLTHVMDITG